jgi:uncharacterized membrane protein
MSRLDRLDAVAIALLSGTAVVSAALYPKLPEVMPTHFDLHGQANGWSSREVGVALVPAIALFTWIVVRFGGAVAGPLFRERLEKSPVKLVALLTTAFLVALHFMMLAAVIRGTGLGAGFGVAVGVFWIVLAQILPRVRRNPFIGVRTACTLSSDENWARTHRFAGWTFTLGGLIALVAAAVGSNALVVSAVLVSAIVPMIYSFVVARTA